MRAWFHATMRQVIRLAGIVVGLVAAVPAARGEFTILHAFSDADGGVVPFGSVIKDGEWLYGTTAFTTSGTGDVVASGGVGGGMIYAVRPDGTGFRIVKSFAAAADGQNPFHGLAVSGSSLVGVTRNGGRNGQGVLFKVGMQGDGYAVLHDFDTAGGASPYVGPVVVGNTLYGMTFQGGAAASGVIYAYDLATSTYSVVHDFPTVGGQPFGTLTQVGDWLYGLVSDHRSTSHFGAMFRFRPGDRTFETVHVFQGGSQGGYPYDTLTWDGDRYLYGTALGYYPFTGETAPLADEGVIFRYDLVANQYQVIHDFASQAGDGAKPNSSMLVAPDGSLYGIAHGTEIWGGAGYEFGTLYRLDADGSNFTVLHTFDSLADGNTPMRAVLMIDGTLYGTTAFGGVGRNPGNGTVWAFAVPEPGLAGPMLVSLGLIAARRRRALGS